MSSPEDDYKGKTTLEPASGADLTLKQALELYDSAKSYTDSYVSDWDKYYKVYKRQRVNRHYEGISDPNIPEAHTIIETLVANIAGGDIKFHFVKTNEEQTDDTDVLNSLLDYYLLCNGMKVKNQEWVRDMLLYGTGVIHVIWEDGKPRIENIPLRDFFVDPTSTGLVNTLTPARYAGFVYLGNKNLMKRMQIFDPEQNQWVPKYQNLDKLEPNTDDKKTDKEYKDQFQGSTLGEKADQTQIKVIRLYDLDSGKLIEIGNRREIIYQDDIPFQREEQTRTIPKDVTDPGTGVVETVPVPEKLDEIEAFLPFAALRDYIDSSLFYGEGEMAQIMDSSERLNDLESMDIDNLAYQNTPMYQIDPQFADLAPEIETIPGAVYPIPKGAISSLPIAEIAGNLDEKKDRVMQEMRSATAADEAVQGVQIQQARVTATEVQSQLNQAQNRFSTKIQNLEAEGYAQLAHIIYKLTQIFVSTKMAVRIVGKQGVYFKDYDPWEYNGEWEPNVELDSTQQAKQLEVGQRLNQMFEYLKDNNTYNQTEVGRFILQHLDPSLSDEQYNQMVNQNPGPTPEQIAEIQKNAAKPPTELVNFSYKDAGDWTKAQLEQMFGLQPDPLHFVRIRQEAMSMGAQEADLLNPHTDAEGKPDPSIPQPQVPPQKPEGMQ